MNHPDGKREYLRAADRREQLLDAAVEVISSAGAAALSLRSVAERAGVAHRVVHYAFGSKSELVIALLRRESARTMALVWDSPLPSSPLGEAVERSLLAYAADLAARGDLHRAVAELTATARTTEGMRDVARIESELYLDAIAARLRQWQEDTGAHLTLPAEAVAASVLVIADGLASWVLSNPDDALLPDVVRTLSAAFGTLSDG